MRRLRHVEDKLLATSLVVLNWPLSDTSKNVELRRNPVTPFSVEPFFEDLVTGVNINSIWRLPLGKQYDYCMLSLRGTVDSQALAVGNQFNNDEGGLHVSVWGDQDDLFSEHPVFEGSGSAPMLPGKQDAWFASGYGAVGQNPSGTVPFFGYTGSSMQTGSQHRITPAGFVVNRDAATGRFGTTVGDKWSVVVHVGRLRMGDLLCSGVRNLYFRFLLVNPTLLSYDPVLDYFKVKDVLIMAHLYESTHRDWD